MAELVLVTGANGHLGSNTVRSLLEKGYKVKALVRKTSNLDGIRELPIELVYGDILDKASVSQAVKGSKYVIHHAAVYKILGKSVEDIMKPAIIGTQNIFEAAAEEGIKRLIYTSSVMAIGNTDKEGLWLNEETWNTDKNVPYAIAKTESEKLARKLSFELDVPTIVINPGGIFGRNDYSLTPSNKIIKNMAKGLYMTAKGRMSVIDARDVAEIHVLALKQGKVGERYIAISNVLEMNELGTLVSKFTGKKVIHSPFSRRVNIVFCWTLEKMLRVFGLETSLPFSMAKEYSHRFANHDNSKLKRDFGIKFHPIEATIKSTLEWLVERNEIKSPKKLKKSNRNTELAS